MTGVDEILGGYRKDPFAVGARCTLLLGEPIYQIAARLRNATFDRGWRQTHRVSVPVISVGNLTTGGTGKTPVVRWIAETLMERSHPVVLSRGYRSDENGQNDEFLELKYYLPDLVHLQNPDRVAIAGQAIEQHDAKVLILDDGFQHRRLHRDLDLVLVDATRPFGYGHLLPRGLLREPISSLRRADMAIVTRCDLVDDLALRNTVDQIAEYISRDAIATLKFVPSALLDHHAQPHTFAEYAGRSFLAFCGLGNPDSFQATLQATLGPPTAFIPFPDHHPYTSNDVQSLWDRAGSIQVDLLVCTMKDLVKIRRHNIPEQLTVAALVQEIEFVSGSSKLLEKFSALFEDPVD